jgi:hypothetical protein
MRIPKLDNNIIPSFCWDRNWTLQEIRNRIADSTAFEQILLIAWVLREGTPIEIWNIFSPKDIFPVLKKLLPFLGRRKNYWIYTYNVWHKLGKV